ncbi:glycosyltransferase [Gordonia rubripertincta]|uniref:Glycosyltransferase n=2 Tax=Gordonia rubripertincta TaxID=36822 RepID=A0AAW6RAM4_GORRU|nr:glycosyltransferase [Gordonia rubripertincta]MDG6781847.1 glycosyltransferase [Gordonia rubripertincta]NKY65368.1 glycosyltransferase family 2 protein [Gordonia rubripertincta]GAB83357.1 hypothetical protein GORBP_003_00060 [Gordonia rubripertincta NBRC 101908]
MTKELLIGVPVFGQIEYTHALVSDLIREGADFVIIDNKGDYTRLADERVEHPGRNLGWAGGSNFGFRLAFSEGYQNAVTLNNDTRISVGYVDALLDSALPADRGLVTAVYDDEMAHRMMLADYRGPADQYIPANRFREVPFVDGTGLLITREAWRAVGSLDERTFGTYAWGADLDLSLRVRQAGFKIYVTERGFLNHLGQRTATASKSRFSYQLSSFRQMKQGMRRIGLNGQIRADSKLPVVTRSFE